MKKSKFVFEVKDYPVEGGNLWFSTATGKMTVVSDELNEMIESGTADENNKKVQNLYNMKFLVPDDFNERMWAQHIYNSVNYADKGLGITITPSMLCNFCCIYCCEPDKNKINNMKMDTAKDIVDWVEQRLSTGTINKLEVQYFGGEPTYNREVLFFLAGRIQEISQKYHVKLKNYIVTNGFFEREMIDNFLEMGINNIQLTIDGTPNSHNKRRLLLVGNQETFDVVYSNFLYCAENADRFEEINLRINIDESNMGEVIPLIDKVAKDTDATKINIDLNETNWRGKTYEEYTGIRDFIVSANRYAINLGFRYDFHQGHFDSCNFSKINNIVIGADGNVYKCLMMVNEKEFKASYIKDYFSSFDMIKFASYEVDDSCYDCKYCPMCFGGCKAAAFVKNGSINKKFCRKKYFEDYLEDHLKLYFESLSKNENNASV